MVLRPYGTKPVREDYKSDFAYNVACERYHNEIPYVFPCKVVAFLQNMWFKDPVGVKRIFDKRPELREELISRFLFMGCMTGRRLRKAFPEETIDQIVWEEVSREFGGKASSCFEPDEAHIRGVLEKHKPGIVLTFGKIAEKPLRKIHREGVAWELLVGPHPAARHGTVTKELDDVAYRLKRLIMARQGKETLDAYEGEHRSDGDSARPALGAGS
jgi:hypothetical protein